MQQVRSKQDQEQLIPEKVLESLKNGNQRFIENKRLQFNYLAQSQQSENAQHPEAFVLSCIDSRVPVEIIFDRGVGDLFVARVAGNIINDDVLGSMEYGCHVAGAKVIVVLGHQNCGAISAAIKKVELGNITELLKKIDVEKASISFNGAAEVDNSNFVSHVCESNVLNSINEIREGSSLLKTMEDKGEIIIRGGVYMINSGKIEWL